MQSVTRGLVGDTTFAVLPNITPRMSFILTLAAQIVSSPNIQIHFLN
jgi:alpha-1,3-glucosyltransferase